MRIIAGSLGGRHFDAPSTSNTHPMSERMRGALFNSLGDLEELTVLDVFGGSGALSFEAVSRGAKRSIVVEVDKKAYLAIAGNIDKLGLGTRIKAIRANVSGWSDNNPAQDFDIVIADPPFDGIKLSLIQKLTKHVKLNGLFVLSWPTKQSAPKIPGLNLTTIKEKNYGDAQLVFYRKTE